MDEHGAALLAAESAVAADQLLEGGDLLGRRLPEAVHGQVAGVRQGVVAAQVGGRVRSERGERVEAVDVVVAQVPPAVRAEHERSPAVGAHQHEPDAGVRGQSVEQLGVPGLDLFHGHPARQPGQVDQGEVAGGRDDDLGVGGIVVRR
jgi:hypothetical protein